MQNHLNFLCVTCIKIQPTLNYMSFYYIIKYLLVSNATPYFDLTTPFIITLECIITINKNKDMFTR